MNQLRLWLKVLYLSKPKDYWYGVCTEHPKFTTPFSSCESIIVEYSPSSIILKDKNA